ncbi:hypothetical protein AQJ91_12410 [Streptomyces dysideae]|uniref:Uncharacterized protein n=1 Tax=Streptomyces dysideae TaxID=909626 RepID=A0A117S167_9ACTN|nr:hypothetical protein AQJ91_12410 [Streptomyces dysideae]
MPWRVQPVGAFAWSDEDVKVYGTAFGAPGHRKVHWLTYSTFAAPCPRGDSPKPCWSVAPSSLRYVPSVKTTFTS